MWYIWQLKASGLEFLKLVFRKFQLLKEADHKYRQSGFDALLRLLQLAPEIINVFFLKFIKILSQNKQL